MAAVLDWTSGICWSLVYAIALFVGIRNKTYCIPSVCICLNFSWELWAVSMRILNRSSLDSGFVSQLMWLILDVGVLYTWLRYNEGTLRKKLLLFFAAAIFMAAATLVADLWEYAAFGINLIMSIIFLFRLDSQMQPLISIALLKCIGTFAPTILNGILYRNLLILAIGGLCFIADLYYIYELYVNRNDT